MVKLGASIVALFRPFTGYFPDLEVETTRMFVSADRAAYDNIWHNLWPPWVVEPPEHLPVHELDLIRFQDGLVSDYVILFFREAQEMVELGCFAMDKCPELRTIVNHYLAAWSSRIDMAAYGHTSDC